MRKQREDSGYDYSRIGYARRHAIQTLDDYACSTAEIIGMFGCSPATFHRYDQDVRLSRRPARTARWYEMPPADAKEIAMIALVRADYTVAEIAEAIGVSPATVYRERDAYQTRLGATSRAEERHIYRHLKGRIIDDRSRHQRRLDTCRRGRRWRRGSRGKICS
jgi:DNA-binding CsgD family transcriptional regulator